MKKSVRTRAAVLAVCAASAVVVWLLVRDQERSASGVASRDGSAPVAETALSLVPPARDADVAAERGAVAVDTAPTSVEATATPSALPPKRSVRVRVVDRERAPVAHALVGASVDWPQLASVLGSAVTDRKGEARIDLRSVPPPSASVTLSLLGAHDPAHVVRFAGDAWPTDVVELVVDAGGSLEVHVRDGTGRPMEGAMVHVAERGLLDIHSAWWHTQSTPAWSARATTDGAGLARFAGVGAGLAIGIQVMEPAGVDPLWVTTTGPPRGEVRRVDVAFDSDDVVLIGEVDCGHSAWGRSGWTVHWVEDARPAWPGSWRFDAPANARTPFRLRVRREALEARRSAPWIVFSEDFRPAAFFDMRDRLAPGEYDLGTIHAVRDATLFAGVARHENGMPYAGGVAVELRGPWSSSWFALPAVGVDAGANGEFRIEGRGDTSFEWRIRPTLPGKELVEPERIAPGTEGIDLVIRTVALPPTRLRGSIAVDEGDDRAAVLEKLRVRFRPHGAPMAHRATPAADGTFEIETMGKPGHLEVGVEWHEGALASVADAVGADGVVPDAPVWFDLRGRLGLARILTRDPAGAPVEIRLRPRGAPAATLFTGRVNHGAILLVHDTPLEAIASRTGLRDVHVRLGPGDNEIRFERDALAIRLVWAGMPHAAANERLRPILVRAEDVRENLRTHIDLQEGVAFDGSGVARTRVSAPGRYLVLLQLDVVASGTRRASIHVPGAAHPAIVVEDGDTEVDFAVHWDAEPVLERFSKMR